MEDIELKNLKDVVDMYKSEFGEDERAIMARKTLVSIEAAKQNMYKTVLGDGGLSPFAQRVIGWCYRFLQFCGW